MLKRPESAYATRRRALQFSLATAAVITAAGPSRAATWAPANLRIIVPFPAGRVTDVVARVLAESLRAAHGTNVVVDNRPGANATIGLEMLRRSAPDGATLLVGGLGSHGLPPAMVRNYPYDVNTDFTALAIMAEFVNAMVVSPAVTAANVQEFIAYARANPGKLNYVYTSTGASNQMTAELFKLQLGLDIVGVPLGQVGNSLVMLQRNDVQVAFENLPTVKGAIAGGNLRALAVTSPYRTPQLPEIPTLIEAGVPDFSVTSWIGIYGPPAMDPALLTGIEAELRRIAATDAAKQLLTTSGFEPTFKGHAEFAPFQRAEVERWKRVAREARIDTGM
ncbi:tripartite tricarboxylate transporter substrate binding protein [Rhodovarius crocodyli]|uniref:Tripartite tricarboxylate transporter substrate binding protein n=1 Tax=Rhodovarius crocodyli TaxID=1979269 RepID=A0A437M1Q3_9PROT|nr:tripartite tricarboxylate transporter substrate binding protein [Rhodovarius crocodyli]RVT91617.1 tripartite tricarboxylate transporter substrate binding protein [Rhodovarius crocodyli]